MKNLQKLKKQARHLRLLRSVLGQWDFYTEGSNGSYKNTVRVISFSFDKILTKTELEHHIELTKQHMARSK